MAKLAKTISLDERLNMLIEQARQEIGISHSDVINRVMLHCLQSVLDAEKEQRVPMLIERMRERAA